VKPSNEQLHIERQKTALVMDAAHRQWKEITGLTTTMEVTLMIRPTTDLPLESTNDDKTVTVVTETTCPSAPELFTRRMC